MKAAVPGGAQLHSTRTATQAGTGLVLASKGGLILDSAPAGAGEPGDSKHKYWFVMPLASGNLADRAGLYKGNLDAVLQVALRLAQALEAAHAQGITHRDVKPGNILFP